MDNMLNNIVNKFNKDFSEVLCPVHNEPPIFVFNNNKIEPRCCCQELMVLVRDRLREKQQES